MEVRPATTEDGERVREVVDSSMTGSYQLSPDTIRGIAEEQFGDDALRAKVDSSDAVVLVAEADVPTGEGGGGDETVRSVVGVVQAEMAEGRGDVRWLHVDPEHRGRDIGTRLFEAAIEELDERGARHVQASSLAANWEGETFYERLGYERVDRRTVDLAGEELREDVFRPVETGDNG